MDAWETCLIVGILVFGAFNIGMRLLRPSEDERELWRVSRWLLLVPVVLVVCSYRLGFFVCADMVSNATTCLWPGTWSFLFAGS